MLAGGTSEPCEKPDSNGAAPAGIASMLIAAAANSLEMDFIGLTSLHGHLP